MRNRVIVGLVLLWMVDSLMGCQPREEELFSTSKVTGFYLRTEEEDFWIAEQDDNTFYAGEPVKISAPSWDEDTTVSFDTFENGDRIEVEILQIGDTEPRSMPVYSVTLVEKGTVDNIDDTVITYLATLGYVVKEN